MRCFQGGQQLVPLPFQLFVFGFVENANVFARDEFVEAPSYVVWGIYEAEMRVNLDGFDNCFEVKLGYGLLEAVIPSIRQKDGALLDKLVCCDIVVLVVLLNVGCQVIDEVCHEAFLVVVHVVPCWMKTKFYGGTEATGGEKVVIGWFGSSMIKTSVVVWAWVEGANQIYGEVSRLGLKRFVRCYGKCNELPLNSYPHLLVEYVGGGPY